MMVHWTKRKVRRTKPAELEERMKENNAGIELQDGIYIDMLMYADDIVLISSSAAGLQKHLNTLSNFCQKKKLEVNTEKTKVCAFGRGRISNTFCLNNHTLEIVQSYKYLGIYFTKNGQFHVAKKHLAKQANKGNVLTTNYTKKTG